MPGGKTYTSTLNDSLPTMIGAARQVREFEGVMSQLVDKKTLGRNIGLTWNEISLAQLTAQGVTETQELDNPQAITDTLFSITPTVVGIQTFVSDRVKSRIARPVVSQMGSLGQNAIQRKKDEDGITVLDGATTSLCGAGTTLTQGHIQAATRRITSNATEPANKPFRAVLHGFQIKDIEDALRAGVGTYDITSDGLTARVFKEHFDGMVGSAQLYEDGNITIDATSNDAKGGVFARDAIVLVQGRSPWNETRREPHIGGGGDSIFLYDEFAYGERSAGNWLYEILSDASTPTS